MNGYFITEEQAKELGLLNNPEINLHLQKTIVVITENDIKNSKENIKLSKLKINEMANWFYKNYYNGLIESITSF